MNRLILCSGRTRKSGWKTLDANPAYQPDYLSIIPPLPTVVRSIQWDEIEWIHGITSFYPWDAAQILRELAMCMAPSGKLILEQPNARLIDVGSYPEWVFGDPSLKDPLHMNKWTYTQTSLERLLRECGFSRTEIMPARYHVPERDFRIEARI